MLTLSLLRHAKAARNGSTREDAERPLARRGRDDAARIGAFLTGQKLVPDLILCSPARRTRETLDLLLPALAGPAPKIVFDDGLYLAAPSTILARVRKAKPKARHIMAIGHNPGIQALALDLVGHAERADIVALGTKFPTAGLAAIEFDVESWTRVRPTEGRLRLFTTPKRLAG